MDLVYNGDRVPKHKKLALFRYPIIWEHKQKIWDEMHVVKALSGHFSFISFDRIIIDDVESRVLGFTQSFIPGGD